MRFRIILTLIFILFWAVASAENAEIKSKNLFLPLQNRNYLENKKNKILVFVSFSMPENSLKQWLFQANKLNAVLIIRGLVNNSFKETAQEIGKLLENKKGGMQLDPTLFKKFDIKKVPAVVVIDDDKKNYDVVYGDVPLDYALKIMGWTVTK